MRGLEVVGVDLQEKPEVVRQFGEDFGIAFPLWIDHAGQGPPAFGVRGHPNTVLINRAGQVVGRVLGERDWNSPEAHQLVEALLRDGR